MTDTFDWDNEKRPYEPIHLLDGKEYDKSELISKMDDDSFYYGWLNKNAFSSSVVKDLYKSKRSYVNSLTKPQKETAALRDGRLIHTVVLEPERVDEKYATSDFSRTTKKYKELALSTDKEVVLSSEMRSAKYLNKCLMDCDETRELLSGGIAEVPVIGEIMGYPFRAKADYLRPDRIVDLKTTTEIDGWEWAAKNKWHYNIQAYIYTTLFNVSRFTFVIVEKGSGNLLVAEATDEFIQSGKYKLEMALANYSKDEKQDVRRIQI